MDRHREAPHRGLRELARLTLTAVPLEGRSAWKADVCADAALRRGCRSRRLTVCGPSCADSRDGPKRGLSWDPHRASVRVPTGKDAMRRLTLLLVALSLAVFAPAAHVATADGGGPTASAAQASPPPDRDGDGAPDSQDQCPDTPGQYSGCPPPPDRDGDHYPDSSDECPDLAGNRNGCPDRDGDFVVDPQDRCPDEPGNTEGGTQGCPASYDRDHDGVLNTDDKCPDAFAHTADGCQPFLWQLFFINYNGIDQFLNAGRNVTHCQGLPKCKATNVVLTISAATAKEAGITKRKIADFSIPIPESGNYPKEFGNHISSVNRKKLARLHKIVVTVEASVTMMSGDVIKAAPKTRTIYRKQGVGTQFNSAGPNSYQGV